MQTIGNIPQIIKNVDDLYVGDLVHYFRVVFNHARNLRLPYHNFRHMFHVLWLCHQAGMYYKKELTRRDIRNLLIAAMFHDYDHRGLIGDDDINIVLATRGLERHILDEDRPSFNVIRSLINATEYPYKGPSESLSLSAQIIRDADLSQVLSVAWIQQVVFGLATEWNKKPIEVLAMQGPFMSSLKFHTEWAQKLFPQSDIEAKIAETRLFLDLLNGSATQ